MMSPRAGKPRGFVLVMALWALAFLSVLALSIAMGTRQRIFLLERLETRSQEQLTAEAGCKKAAAILADDIEDNPVLTAASKMRRHNDPEAFSGTVIGGRVVDVVCAAFDDADGHTADRPGLCDEQSKLNLNATDIPTLTALARDVLGIDGDTANRLARAIVDWRDFGQREATGFFSDDYYKNLEFPYEMKEKPFERMDELLLVRGMTLEMYEKLSPFLTLYGDGKLNINTVSGKVLRALGMDEALIDKILRVRRGADKTEATADDHIFLKTFDIAAEVNDVEHLQENEARQLDALNSRGVFSTGSFVYSWAARVRSPGKGDARSIEVVFNGAKGKYLYWREK